VGIDDGAAAVNAEEVFDGAMLFAGAEGMGP
jgi:hypothetical protein